MTTTPCSEHPNPDLWFPAGYDSRQYPQIVEAKRLCGGCPFAAQCLEVGMQYEDGVWGGLTPRERAKLREAGAA